MANAKAQKTKRPFGKRDIIGYFFGDFGCNMSFSLQSAWLFIFYTQFVGIKLNHWAILILVTKLFDGINDPIAGFIIDKLGRNKDGEKFKPWIKYGGPILAIVPVLMFIDSSGWAYPAKLAICFVSYFAWDLAYTIVNVPYGSLSSVMTSDPVQRTQLSTARSYGSIIGSSVISAVIPPFVYKSMNLDGEEVSVFVGENMFYIAIVLGIVALASFAILYMNVEERVVAPGQANDDGKGGSSLGFGATLKAVVKNRPFWGLVVAAVGQILFLTTGTSQLYQLTLQMYYKNGSLGSYITLINLTPIIVGGIIGNGLVKKYGKKEVTANPILISTLIIAVMYVVPIESPYVYLAVLVVANTICFGLQLYIWAMVSDAIDYQEYLTGSRNEGSIYALYSMARKIMQGLGSWLVPTIMTAAAPTLLVNDPTTWTAGNSLTIKNMSIGFAFFGYLISFIGLKFIYNLDKDSLQKMNDELARRRNVAAKAQ